MKNPDQCRNLLDIRIRMDAIDSGIIAKLGLRSEYVKAAASFKRSLDQVAAPQ